MPPGTISAKLNEKLKCEGYQNYGMIIINYDIKSGTNKGTKFQGTLREG